MSGADGVYLSCFSVWKESDFKPCHRVKVDFSLSGCDDVYLPTHQPIEWHFHTPEEEIRYV